MAIQGYIPANVTYFLKPKTEYKVRLSEDPLAEAEVTEYRPVFVADTKNKAMMNRGERFKSGYGESITRDNTPFRIKFICLGHRVSSPFHERFKAVTEEGYVLDVDTETMLDIVKHTNITDGTPDATFIWARKNRDFVLIRVGSVLMQRMEEATEVRDKKAFKPTELEIGDICEDTYYSRSKHVYLGPVEILEPTRQNPNWTVNPNFDYGYTRQKAYMFYDYYDSENNVLPADAPISAHLENQGNRAYNVSFIKNINFKIKNGRKAVPNDICERVRNIGINEVRTRSATGRIHPFEGKEPYWQKWISVKPANSAEPILPEEFQVPIRRA